MQQHILCKTLFIAFIATIPMLANAQLSANVAVTSNYKFRGQDQNSSKSRAVKPALQGGFDYAFGDSGWYLGNWNSSVDWLPGNSIESDLYGGHKFAAGGVNWDLGALTYVYPGNNSGNTTELYAAAGWGPLTLKYAHTVSKDYFGFAGAQSGSGLKGRNTGYLNLAVAKEVAPALTLKAALGYTRFASDIHHLGVPNYVDYAVGVSYDFGGGLAAYGGVQAATKRSFYGDSNKPRAIVTLGKTL